MQVYEGLPILTGAASEQEQARLEHRLLGFVPIDQTFSAGAYAERAHATIDALLRTAAARSSSAAPACTCARRWPSSTSGRRSTPRSDAAGRATRDASTSSTPRCPTHVAQGIAPSDRQRILRAHELIEAGHEPPPPAHAPSELWTAQTRHPTLLAALTMERGALYERIEQRIDAMLEAGVRAEVQKADADGASATARKALGFQELLDGDVEAMRTKTRRYAKRQLTWLRKLPNTDEIDMTNRTPDDVAAELEGRI